MKRIVCARCQLINNLVTRDIDPDMACHGCGSRLFGKAPVDMSLSTLDHHIENSDIPLLIGFYKASWDYHPALVSAFRQASEQFSPQVIAAEIDVARHIEVSESFQLKKLPTLMLFWSRREVARTSEVTDLNELAAWLRISLRREHFLLLSVRSIPRIAHERRNHSIQELKIDHAAKPERQGNDRRQNIKRVPTA